MQMSPPVLDNISLVEGLPLLTSPLKAPSSGRSIGTLILPILYNMR